MQAVGGTGGVNWRGDLGMKLLVVGGGGREHALCWSLSGSSLVDKLYCAPGSHGISACAECLPIAATDVDALCASARDNEIDIVVVGPEGPLALGLVDRLEASGIRAFGPTQAAAQLESSKAFMKAFAERHGIPTARYRVFEASEVDGAKVYLDDHELPVVIKADGLAAGKGVTVAHSNDEAQTALEAAFAGAFGDAGSKVVIEEFLDGEEASLFAICDGQHALEIGTAQDHKRAFDGDQGPNTGGMGAYSPAPILDQAMIARVMSEIVDPTLAGMQAEGTPFKGFLYVGLMIGASGPKVVEFNVRFGDPECQVVLPRLMTDLAQLVEGACKGMLHHMSVRWHAGHALAVVMAAKGYPGAYEKGSSIGGLDQVESDDTILFHAGTENRDGAWCANGGRVLAITGLGKTLQDAKSQAYGALAQISWPDGYYRQDIGWRALTTA